MSRRCARRGATGCSWPAATPHSQTWLPMTRRACSGTHGPRSKLMEQDDDPPSDILASALKNIAYHELRLGQGLSLPLLERAALAEQRSEPVPVIDRVGMCLGMLLRFAGRFAEARHWLLQMRESAEDEGDESALPNILGHLALLECWAGDYPMALSYAAEGLDLATRTGIGSPSVTAAHALAQAHIGHIDDARRIAHAALAHDESQFDLADVACDLRSLGFADLSVEDFSTATAHFLRALSIAEELGVNEPAILRIHADAVESLVGLGRLADAERLTEELEATGGADAMWSRVMARRCRGLLLAAVGDLPAAVTALASALEDHPAVGMPFEEARTRLWLGKVLRRAGRRSEARESLEKAEAAFRKLGTPVYADRAHAELGRLGGRVAEALQAHRDRDYRLRSWWERDAPTRRWRRCSSSACGPWRVTWVGSTARWGSVPGPNWRELCRRQAAPIVNHVRPTEQSCVVPPTPRPLGHRYLRPCDPRTAGDGHLSG